MKKIEEEKIIIQCDCHGGHFIVLSFWDIGGDTGEESEGYLEMLGDFECPPSLWSRIKGAWSVFRMTHWHWASVVLTKDDSKRIREFLEKIEPKLL
jgi:hypothetical protein